MLNFNQYESEHYDFYRFTRLVIDIVITPNNFNIPYDVEMKDIYSAYNRFEYSDNCNDPYAEMVEFISSDKELLLSLQASNDGY